MNSKTKSILWLYKNMERLGLDAETADQLRRIERTLCNWSIAECNGGIERDDETNKPFRRYGNYVQAHDPRSIHFIPDRETAALKRLAKIMAPYKRRLVAYHQGDPRGCSLYICRRSDIQKRRRPLSDTDYRRTLPPGTVELEPFESALNSNYTCGVAVCL